MMGPELLAQLVSQHATTLVLYARQWCDTPEDVVQEALLKLVRLKKPPDKLLAWAFRAVRNGALTAARSARRRRRHEGVAAGKVQPLFQADEDSTLDAQTAAEALGRLPIEQREAIIAHLWGGLAFDEIGALAGCSSSTAHRWYLAGIMSLREILGISCPTSPEVSPSEK